MGVIIDTSIWVDVERGRLAPLDVARLTGDAPVYAAPRVLAELEYGAYRAVDPGQRHRRLSALPRIRRKPCLVIDGETGATFGRLAFRAFLGILSRRQGGRTGMAPPTESIRQLIEEYRARCLWFLRPDYFPASPAEILSTLSLIERYGDRAGYLRAREIRSWLSPPSKPQS